MVPERRASVGGLPPALVLAGGSLRVLRDWLLCTCLSTLLFRSSSVDMLVHYLWKRPHTASTTPQERWKGEKMRGRVGAIIRELISERRKQGKQLTLSPPLGLTIGCARNRHNE